MRIILYLLVLYCTKRWIMTNLKYLRMKKNLSIAQLAKATRIPKITLIRLENGHAQSFSFKNLNKLCHFFNLSNVNELIGERRIEP